MWVGFVVIVLASGQTQEGSMMFPSQKACLEANAKIVKQINDPKRGVIAFEMDCKSLSKMKKPGANV